MAFVSLDEFLGAVVPPAVYWIYAAIYTMLGPYLEEYRLHPVGEEQVKNMEPKATVIRGVLLEQACQIVVVLLAFVIRGEETTSITTKPPPSCLTVAMQFAVAMVVFDTWEYFMHRYLHTNKFLYKHIHSQHHKLLVPYAFGSLYNHPVESLLMDTLGGVVSFLVSGMSPRTAIFFYSFATIKAVDDHCGYYLPWNPFHVFFANSSPGHDIHHQIYGSKYNFSAPFFVFWDRLFGTYMPCKVVKRKGGGFEARPLKDD